VPVFVWAKFGAVVVCVEGLLLLQTHSIFGLVQERRLSRGIVAGVVVLHAGSLVFRRLGGGLLGVGDDIAASV
jgi:hypothetical protein